MTSQTILISGGTGMVGTALTSHLVSSGHKVIILTRHPAKARPKAAWAGQVSYAAWDVKAGTIDMDAVAQADALVHLAGAGVVDRPWTDAYKKEIRDSRVNSSALLVKAIGEVGGKLHTVVSASAIGWYGEDGPGQQTPFTEDAPAAPGFLGDTCRAWEESIQPVTTLGKRLVICRIGIVLSNEGGALPEFKRPLMFRVAGVLGSGRQVVSWVHITDLCRIFTFAIENNAMNGVYNAVAPLPVTNRALTLALARQMYGKAFITLPVPVFVLKLMLGARSIEVLKSTTVSAEKLLNAGFDISYPNIEDALAELVG
ncbi:MAG TPA: TIGR01777 family oxidoreductase [Phnomibacter sp.]|nr:TIGR01777 family oxidoreductase [Phnomibacter sp.]